MSSTPPPFDAAELDAIHALAEKLQRIADNVYQPTPHGWRLADTVLLNTNQLPAQSLNPSFKSLAEMQQGFLPDKRLPAVAEALKIAELPDEVACFTSGSGSSVWLVKPQEGDSVSKVIRFSQYESRRMTHPLMIGADAEAREQGIAHAEVLPLVYVLTISDHPESPTESLATIAHDFQPFRATSSDMITQKEAGLVMKVFKAVFDGDKISSGYHMKDLGLLPDGTVCRVDPGDMKLMTQFVDGKPLPDFSTPEYGRAVYQRCKDLGLPAQFFWTNEDGSWKSRQFFPQSMAPAPHPHHAPQAPTADNA